MEKENNAVILDVTAIEPRLKHPTIFKLLEELKEGESIIIKNDHDPKPLHYQLLAEKGEIFDWQYLENGPTEWVVKITKKKLNDRETGVLDKLSGASVGEIASDNPKKIEVFKKYGIDFCCGGGKTLKEACEMAEIDENMIITELNNMNNSDDKTISHNENTFLNQKTKDWSIDFLIDYIVNIHHTFLRIHLPEATEYMEKVAGVHGDRHPELIKIKELFMKMASTLIFHLDKEEKDLFPHIKSLKDAPNEIMKENIESAYKGGTQYAGKGMVINADAKSAVLKEIQDTIYEHEYVGHILKEMDFLSSRYLVPGDACASYKYIYKLLNELTDDIMIHIHLENNVLFKKINE